MCSMLLVSVWTTACPDSGPGVNWVLQPTFLGVPLVWPGIGRWMVLWLLGRQEAELSRQDKASDLGSEMATSILSWFQIPEVLVGQDSQVTTIRSSMDAPLKTLYD